MPEALQSHACGQESTAADQVQEALLSKLSHLPRECALVRAAATLRERASRTLGRDPVRPQLAYKSTSNLVNNYFPRPKAAAVH